MPELSFVRFGMDKYLTLRKGTLQQPLNALELRLEHIEDLVRSHSFQRSAKLSRLLRRLVEPTLAGASQPIKEQILGVEVFDRPADCDPQTDSIVRVHVN